MLYAELCSITSRSMRSATSKSRSSIDLQVSRRRGRCTRGVGFKRVRRNTQAPAATPAVGSHVGVGTRPPGTGARASRAGEVRRALLRGSLPELQQHCKIRWELRLLEVQAVQGSVLRAGGGAGGGDDKLEAKKPG